MSGDQIDYGKAWITDRVVALGASFDLIIDPIQWSSAGDDFRANRHSLAFQASATRHVITFRDEDIEDIEGDETVRATVERQIEEVVRTLAGR
jgi:hypothetical protein